MLQGPVLSENSINSEGFRISGTLFQSLEWTDSCASDLNEIHAHCGKRFLCFFKALRIGNTDAAQIERNGVAFLNRALRAGADTGIPVNPDDFNVSNAF